MAFYMTNVNVISDWEGNNQCWFHANCVQRSETGNYQQPCHFILQVENVTRYIKQSMPLLLTTESSRGYKYKAHRLSS